EPGERQLLQVSSERAGVDPVEREPAGRQGFLKKLPWTLPPQVKRGLAHRRRARHRAEGEGGPTPTGVDPDRGVVDPSLQLAVSRWASATIDRPTRSVIICRGH